MAFVRRERLELAIDRLAAFTESVPSQGIQHLLPLLSLRRRGVNSETFTPYEEADDFAFWDDYFLVNSDSNDGRYYDPFAGMLRVATHPHSNVATARKQTFAASWHAVESRAGVGGTEWRLSTDYLDIVQQKVLTKRSQTSQAPLVDLIVWMRRQDDIPAGMTAIDLIMAFQRDFHLSDEELRTLFEWKETANG